LESEFLMKHFLRVLAVPLALAAAESEVPVPFGVDRPAMNPKVDPCVDFYQYACGNWMATHPIPADKARWSRFEELQERNEAILLDILQNAAIDRPGRSELEQKIGDAFTACMNEAGIEKRKIEPLRNDLERIDGITGPQDVIEEIARLHTEGVGAAFQFDSQPDFKDSSRTIGALGQGGLSLPDRDYYLKTDPKSVETRKRFEAHVERMFQLLGNDPQVAGGKAREILELETGLARTSVARATLRDPQQRYHPMTKAELAKLAPDVPWEVYFQQVGAPSFDTLNVSTPDFIRALGAAIHERPISAWKAYLTYRLVSTRASRLPAAFDQEYFDFYQRTLGGFQEQRPREKRCAAVVDSELGDLLGQKYIERAFAGRSKEEIAQLVAALERSLGNDIRALPWMTDATKKAAAAKLAAISNNVGAPQKWRGYSSVQIAPDDYFGNTVQASRAARARNLARIGKPTDKSEWTMTTPTVNAFYNSLNNSINFPAGILQFPFFDATRDAALNYGAIGAVIGHELTHGFDDAGRKFDGNGNLRDWWTAEDGKEFEKRAACIAGQYGGYTAVDDVKLNGKLTLGENTADNGGVRIALMALLDKLNGDTAKVDGYTPEQRFFLGFAQVWCQNVRLEQARLRALTDPHSPGRFRVNGTLQNMPEFQKAFSCQAGQPMVSANACQVW
jgi:predicted metalloendopeptidase